MATTIDNRVVEMQFNNKDFEKNVQVSINTLDRLEKALQLETASRAFDQLDRSAARVNLDSIAKSVDQIADKFTFFGKITQKAMDGIISYAANVGKSIYESTIGQIKAGGMTRAMNIAQAKFQLSGLKIAWDEVSEAIDYAVDGTAYGLDSAAKAASQLSASGVQLGEDMKAALRGISGVAAMTNSEYDEIAHIFTSVAGQGKVMTMQLNQIGMRGISAAAELAKYLNITEVELRELVTKGKVDFQTFANAMDSAFGEHAKDANKTFTGAMSNVRAALSRVGALFSTTYLDQMIAPLNALRLAINAFKDSLVPLSQIYEILMMKFTGWATQLLKSDKTINTVKNSVQSVMNVFKALFSILAPIEASLRDVFPKVTLTTIENLSKSIVNFTDKLALTSERMDKVRSIFRGFFSVIELGVKVIERILVAIFPFAQNLSDVGDALLTATARFGDFLYCLTEYIDKSGLIDAAITGVINALKSFVSFVKDGITIVANFVKELAQIPVVQVVVKGVLIALAVVIGSVGLAIYGVIKAIQLLIQKLKTIKVEDLKKVLDKLYEALMKLKDILGKAANAVIEFVKSIAQNIKNIHSFGDAINYVVNSIGNFFIGIKNAISSILGFQKKTEPALKAVNMVYMETEKSTVSLTDTIKKKFETFNWGAVVVGAFGIALTKMVMDLGNVIKRFSGLMGSVSNLFGIKPLINEIQQGIKMGNVVKIAQSIAILAASLAALALVPSDKLRAASEALSGLTLVMGGMMTALIYMSRFDVIGSFVKNVNAMVAAAGSLLILAIAMRQLEDVQWGTIGKGLGTFAAMLVLLGGSAVLLAKYAPVLSTGSLALVAIAGSLLIMTHAFQNIENGLDPSKVMDTVGSLIVITGSLGTLALAASRISFGGALGIVALAASIKLMNQALLDIATYGVRLPVIIQNLDKYLIVFGTIYALAGAIRLAGSAALQAGIGIVAISYAVRLMGEIMTELANAEFSVDWNLASKLLNIIATITLLFISTQFAGKNAVKAGVSLLLISASVALLAEVCKKLNDLDQFKAGPAAFVGILLALSGGLVAATALTEKAKMGPILAMIASTGIIATELALLSILDLVHLGVAAGAFAISLLSFAGSMILVSKASENMKILPMIEMIVMLAGVAGSIYLIATLPWDSVVAAGAALALAFTGIAVAAKLGSGIVVQAALAMDLLTLSVIPFAAAFWILAKVPFESLLPNLVALGVALGVLFALGAIAGNAPIIAVGIEAIALGMIQFGVAADLFGVAAVLFSKALETMADAFDHLGKIAPTAAKNIGSAIITIGDSIGRGVASIITGFVDQLTSGLSKALGGITTTIKSLSPSLTSAGSSILTFINNGFIGRKNTTIDLMKTLGKDVSKAFDENTKTNLTESAKDGVRGIIDGFNDSGLISTLWNTVSGIGKGILQAFDKSVGRGSPWKTMVASAQDGDQGMIDGLKSKMKEVWDTASQVGGGIVTNVTGKLADGKEAIVSKLNDVIINPVKNTLSTTSGLFGNLFNLLNGADLALERIKASNEKYMIETGSTSMGDFRMMEQGVDIVSKRTEAASEIMMMAQNAVSGFADALDGGGSGKGGAAGSANNSAKEVKKLWNVMDSGKPIVENIFNRYLDGFMSSAKGSGVLFEGIKNNLVKSNSVYKEMFDKMVNKARTGTKEINETITNEFGKMPLMEYFQKTSDAIDDWKERVTDDFDDLGATILRDFATKAVENFADYILKTSDKYTDEVKGMAKDSQEYLGAMQEAWDDYTKKLEDALKLDLLSENTNSWSASMAKVTQNMQHNIRYVQNYDKTIAQLATRFARNNWDPTILNQWSLEGYAAFDKVAGALEATDSQMMMMLETFKNGNQVLDQVVNDVMGSMAIAVNTWAETLEGASEMNDAYSVSLEHIASASEYVSTIVANRYEQMYDAIGKVLDSNIDAFTEYKLEEEDIMTKDELQEAMRSQKEHLIDYKDTWVDLTSRHLPDELLQQLADMGDEGYKKMKALQSMTDEELNAWVTDYTELMQLKEETRQEIAKTYALTGEATVTAFVNAMDPNGAIPRTRELVQNAIATALNIVPQAAGPGKKLDQNMAQGIKDNTKVATDATSTLANTIILQAEKALPTSKFEKAGGNVSTGLANGINKYSYKVVDAVNKLAREVERANDLAYEIGSPSKLFERKGKFIDQGLANGIIRNVDYVTDSIGDLGYESISAMEAVVDHIYDVLEGNLEFDPTIRPTVDLSELKAASPYINGLFSDRSMQLSRGIISSGYVNPNITTQNGNVTNSNSIVMNVYASPGMDAEALANMVSNKLNRQVKRGI